MNSRDIHEKRFKNRLNGYSIIEVDDFMAQLADTLDNLISEKDQLKTKNEALIKQLDEFKDMERALRESMVTAQKTSIAITDEARTRASAITEAAQEQAKSLLDEASASSEEIISDAQEKAAQMRESQKRLSAVIEEYKKQIRTVMSTQLAAMEDIFIPSDDDFTDDSSEFEKSEDVEQTA